MKKILITALSAAAMIAGVSSSFAQGQVTFNNAAATAITLTNVSAATGSKMFGSAGTYDIGLYMGSAGTTLIADMTLVDLALSPNAPTSTAFNAGAFAGGNITAAGFAAGTQYADIVAGWSASSGSTYAQALASGAGYIGVSGLGFITPEVSPATLPVVFGSGAGQIGGFALLAPSPEPATLALGGLGAAALLLFRRRK
jgi:hypothetical protein